MKADDELQMMLADMLGYDELELVAKLIRHRKELLKAPDPGLSQQNGDSGRLLTRQEREEALRRADAEHKSAPLAASVNRAGKQYPHVYKSNEAGNTISASGQKYSLPVGSQ